MIIQDVPMNPEVKKLWVEALESGRYKQGGGALCYVSSTGEMVWCCLGVLCDLAEKAGVVLATPIRHGSDRGYYGPEEKDSAPHGAYLPPAVKEWAGIKSESGQISEEHEDSLSWMNDEGQSFGFIAGEIRERM